MTITGVVWNDENGNGELEQGEPLFPNAVGTPHAAVTVWDADLPLQSVVTDGNGEYSFTNLRPQTYQVVETNPPGYRSTTSDSVRIEAGCGTSVQKFGDQLAVECPRGLNGIVWNDLNGNGGLDPTEPPVAGAVLSLYDSGGGLAAVRVTEADGVYVFDNLAPDVYRLVEENPLGFPISTTPDIWIVDLVPIAGLECKISTILFGDRVKRVG